jgi:hypothetical protein
MTCERCSKEFTPRVGVQRYCSYTCKRAARRLRKRQIKDRRFVCKQCGMEFFKPSDSGRVYKFCSPKCAASAQRKPVLESRVCEGCWESFFPVRANQQYCLRDARSSKVCSRCQKTFLVRCDKYAERRKFCSKRCVPAPHSHVSSWVYFILAVHSHRLKIGIARHVYERFAALFNANADDLKLLGQTPGGLELEQDLHRELEPFRAHHEWFDWTPEVWEVVARYVKLDPFKNSSYVSRSPDDLQWMGG